MIKTDEPLKQKLLTVSIYATAMAFLESAVVVYLRGLYYPDGFNFPLEPIAFRDGFTELGRELATIAMIIAVASLAGKNLNQRFAWFLWIFAIWDIGYYVFLKILIGWPSSLLTWDVLFLIPLTWVGPVIAPVILSLFMLLLAYSMLYFDRMGRARLSKREWAFLCAGSLVTVFSFLYEHIRTLAKTISYSGDLFNKSDWYHFHFIPDGFAWIWFVTGCILILTGILHFIFRQKTNLRKTIDAQWI